MTLLASLLIGEASAEPISLGVGLASLAGTALYAGYNRVVRCHIYECCESNWIRPNITGSPEITGKLFGNALRIPSLKETLNERLFGQHLAVETVTNAVNAHLLDPSPSKALVLSFHGTTGIGKTHVSRLLAESLFHLGPDSSFIHRITCSALFQHKAKLSDYKVQLSHWVQGNLTACPQSLFVFDDLDKAQPAILDALAPFLDNHHPSASRAIFILISNTGGSDIAAGTQRAWEEGRSRESITLKEMEELIHIAAFNSEGGLQFSRLIERHLVDHFVPFLPLERSHVQDCIREELRRRRNSPAVSEEDLASILSRLSFAPKGIGLWSPSGCRQVAAKVALFLEEERFRQESQTHEEF